MSSPGPGVYNAPLLSTYGGNARSLLFSNYNYKTTATVRQGRPRVSTRYGSLSVSSAIESTSSLLTSLPSSTSTTSTQLVDDPKRTVGVVKNGVIGSLAAEYVSANGINADVLMDTQGAVSGGVVVPRGTWIKGVSFTGGMNLTEHDHWQKAEKLRYIGGTSVSPWLACGVQVSQVIPSYAYGNDTALTSSVSPAYITPSISYTLPTRMPWNRQLPAIQSPMSIGAQVKIPIDGSSPAFDSGVQYARVDDVSVSAMTTNNMTGARLTYHVPVYERGIVRAVAASYDIRPVDSTKNVSTLDVLRKDVNMHGALSVGAELGLQSNLTGKVRLDSDATLSYTMKYLFGAKASVGVGQEWCLQQKKPTAFGVQLELES